MTAAQALADVRRRSGLGLRALARKAGTSHATLHAYESGAKEPRLETVERIAAAAGFALEIAVAGRPDAGPDRQAKGRELVEVLDLAGQFPARHARRLRAPVFGAVVVGAPPVGAAAVVDAAAAAAAADGAGAASVVALPAAARQASAAIFGPAAAAG